MTKTEYAQYIQSGDWQQRRKVLISEKHNICERCELPRWLANLIYDQDLNVHHCNYQTLGNERPEDIEALCRRCHEIETFGRSNFKEIKLAICSFCGQFHWDAYSDYCNVCGTLRDNCYFIRQFGLKGHDGEPLWRVMVSNFAYFLACDHASIREVFAVFKATFKQTKRFRLLCPPRENTPNGRYQ